MRYSVRLNDQAAEDLAEIVLFIARDNAAAAEKLGLALVETAFSLATLPYRGQQMRSRPKARKLIYAWGSCLYRSRTQAQARFNRRRGNLNAVLLSNFAGGFEGLCLKVGGH